MTPAQLATLRTWLDANAAALSDEQARDALNAVASPAYRIYTHSYRSATVAEKLFSSGSGTTPGQDGEGPSTASWEGLVTTDDVVEARR